MHSFASECSAAPSMTENGGETVSARLKHGRSVPPVGASTGAGGAQIRGESVDAPPGDARNLVLDPSGFWVARHDQALSYPEEGNSLCFALEEHSFWFKHRNDVIVSTLQQFPPGGTFFDVGGGNGFVACALEKAGFPTVLIEPGRSGAENAKKRGLRNVICATTDAAGFAPGSMDAIGLFDVVEHIEDDAGFLKSMHKLLRPGGRIYISVPAFQTLWSTEDEFAGHFRRYTRRSLARVLRGAGFEVEYTTCFFWILVLPVFFIRSIPSRLGLRRKPTAESAHNDHTAAGDGILGKTTGVFWSAERWWFRRGLRFPVGGSCLAVAKAK